MDANIINVGNSKGIIIPAKFLKLLGLSNKANIEIVDDKIIISSSQSEARRGWEEMIVEEIEANGQPLLLVPDVFEDEVLEGWTW